MNLIFFVMQSGIIGKILADVRDIFFCVCLFQSGKQYTEFIITGSGKYNILFKGGLQGT